MRSARSQTFVLARDLKPGMVVQARYTGGPAPVDLTVVAVERAADAVERLRVLVGKTSSRAKLRPLVTELEEALSGIENEGREARMVTFAGHRAPRPYGSQDELRYVRQGAIT